MTNRPLSSFVASCGLVLLLAACASPPLRAPVAAARHRQARALVTEARAVLQAQAGLHSGPQRVTSQRNSLTAHDDLLAAQADQAQAWFRLYRSLGGGWNADPSPADQLAAQP